MNTWLQSLSVLTRHHDGAVAIAILLLLLLSFLGWGNLLARCARIRRAHLHPLMLCLSLLCGQALVCWLLGWLAYFHQFTPLYGSSLVIVGALLAIPVVRGWFALFDRTEARRSMRWLAPVAGFALVLLCLYLPPSLNLNDDSTAYAVFPLKIRHLGGIGAEPFSERRLFSLGAHYPLQALVFSFLSVRYVSITEPALGIAMTLLLVGILSFRRTRPFSWRIAGGALLLLVSCVAGSTVLANLAPAFLMVPPLLLLIYSAMQAPVLGRSSEILTCSISLGVLFGYVTSLRPTAMPFAGILLMLAILSQTRHSKAVFKSQAAKGLAAAGLGVALFALPFSLDLYRSSGTFFYPLFGRGFHATASGHAPTVPSVISLATHFRNLIHAPLTDWILILAVAALLLSIRPPGAQRMRLLLTFAAMLLTYALIVYQTGGVDARRYAAPMMLSFLVFAVTVIKLDGTLSWLASLSLWTPPKPIAASLMIAIPLLAISPATYKRGPALLRWVQAKIGVRVQALSPSLEELEDYRRLQSATPVGATILTSLQRNYLFDFNRNRVLINDQPGMVAPPPDWPWGKGGAHFAEYLHEHNVRYVAVMRDAFQPTVSMNPLQGWAAITSRTGELFYTELSGASFSNSIAYESDRLRLYRVPR